MPKYQSGDIALFSAMAFLRAPISYKRMHKSLKVSLWLLYWLPKPFPLQIPKERKGST